MSRCFPFTPREGCVKRGTLRETLMGSLKLQKEKEKASETKRSKPREKKTIETHLKYVESKDNKSKRPSHEKQAAAARKRKVFDPESPPVSKDTSEQAEKSSITEEHEQPVGYLSDGSKSSNKSRQDALSSSIERCGNVLRIRLKRAAAAPESPLVGQPECTTSGRADVTSKYLQETSQVPCQIRSPPADARELVLAKPEASAQLNTTSQAVPSSSRNGSLELESAYEALMEHWVPLPLDHGLDEHYDQDWLFETKRAEGGLKRLRTGEDIVIPSSWPPKAHFLPEAEIYAMPYTVPF